MCVSYFLFNHVDSGEEQRWHHAGEQRLANSHDYWLSRKHGCADNARPFVTLRLAAGYC